MVRSLVVNGYTKKEVNLFMLICLFDLGLILTNIKKLKKDLLLLLYLIIIFIIIIICIIIIIVIIILL